jgi:hypothetical protein
MLSTQLPDYRVNARTQRASVEAPSRPSTVHRGSLKDVARPSTVHRGSHRGSRKKKFVRPLFIEVCSRLSRLALMLPSRVSRVSKKKFPKPNRRAWISSTGRRLAERDCIFADGTVCDYEAISMFAARVTQGRHYTIFADA